jgi:adenylyltransferase/sulfurtransferase
MATNERYDRQMLFAPIGREGQEKLRDARVLLVGCGALGAAHAEALARAGVGSLRIVDRDFVEISNLHRQTLFDESDANFRVPKAAAAKRRLSEINSSVVVEELVEDVHNSNVESIIDGCDLVIDGTDNFQIRYLVNDACVKHKKPWIYGAAVSSYGTTMTIFPGETPCLRCVFEEIPAAGSAPTCDTAGVILPIITSISAIQVAEALKFLTGNRSAMHGSLIQIDVWENTHTKIRLGEPEPDCIACGRGIYEFLDAESAEFSAVLCGRDAVQIAPPTAVIDLDAIADRIKFSTPVMQNEYLLRFSAEGMEITVFRDGRAIIRGTEDISAARSLYAKYVGT